MLTRRDFGLGLASTAFGGLALAGCSHLEELPDHAKRIPGFRTGPMAEPDYYGELVPDKRHRLLDLPAKFHYEVISWKDEWDGRVDSLDGGDCAVPDRADGMGSFAAGPGKVALVRNHETTKDGGTTTIVYDYVRGERLQQFRSLSGTLRNCAGGVTPWGSWLSCEEDLTIERLPGGKEIRHGYVYEVPALSEDPPRRLPLVQLGRFNHEAAAVDPVTRAIYMTEDRIDGLLYRFVADRPDDDPLGAGRLQALALCDEQDDTDVRNWSRPGWRQSEERPVRWVTLRDALSDLDDPRKRAHRAFKALRFACGEGIHFGNNELFFTCTSGGRIRSGQIMRYAPAAGRPDEGTLSLFFETTDPRRFNFGDNLTIAPNGHLLVCEDPYFGGERNYLLRPIAKKLNVPPPCYVRGVTPIGEVYDFARLHGGSELAGGCFSPDGKVLFLNIQSPTRTVAIRGPWRGGIERGWRVHDAAAKGYAPLP